jgi:hypothetical protein
MPSFKRTKGGAISVVPILSVARRIKLPRVVGADGRLQRRELLLTVGNVVDLMEALRPSVGKEAAPSVAVEQFTEEASSMPAPSMANWGYLGVTPEGHTRSS